MICFFEPRKPDGLQKKREKAERGIKVLPNNSRGKATLKQLSELSGVSIATVSNALNHKKGVNAKTAANVFRIAKEIGYITEDRVDKIKIVIFRKTGEIIDDSPAISLILDGMEDACKSLGYEIVLSYLNQEDANYKSQVSWLTRDNSAALIMLGTELADKDMQPFKNVSFPILTLDYWSGDMSFSGVLVNNFDSARMAVSYLISKGHKRIGYLRGSLRIKPFHQRSQGYQSAMRAAGLPIEQSCIFTLKPSSGGAYADMLKLLKGGVELPTAFFADNDVIALGTMKALLECGYKIPEDVSIVGFDDLPYSEMSTPPLTTIRVPRQEMGQLAVRRIVEMVNNPGGAKIKTEICAGFIERQSVRSI